MTRWLFNVGWALLVLLGIAAFILSAGANSELTNPTTTSFGPSGSSALLNLLQASGYKVRVDRLPSPKLDAGDVAIAFQIDAKTHTTSNAEKKVVDGDSKPDVESPSKDDGPKAVVKDVDARTKDGVVVFWLPLTVKFEADSIQADKPSAFARVDGKVRSLSTASAPEANDDETAISIASSKAGALVTASKVGKGYEIDYADGIGLTNRYIDKADNAQFFLETLKTYAPAAKEVVFTEGTFGQIDSPGFLETLGPWAEGAWYQLIFLFIVIVVTLNRRFGLPLMVRKRQTGTRELVDALTDTMIRAKATPMTLESVANQTDLNLRSLLKLPRDASPGERDRILPASLVKALSEVRAASTMKKPSPRDSQRLIATLETEYEAFSSQKVGTPTSRLKRKNLL